eukprot:EG_transcript_23723
MSFPFPGALGGDVGPCGGPCQNPGLASLRPKPKPSWAREAPPLRSWHNTRNVATYPTDAGVIPHDTDNFPSGATKYSSGGGGTFRRTPCTTHKYGTAAAAPPPAEAAGSAVAVE